MSPTATSKLVQRVVLWDVYSWITETPGRPDRPQHHSARFGQTIEISAEEAERGESFDPPALGTAGEAVVAAQAAAEPPAVADEQLDSMSHLDLIAYVGQRPSEAERVLAREESRKERNLGKPRKSVVDAAKRVIEVRTDTLEELAEASEAERLDAAAIRSAGVAREVAGGAAPLIP